MAAWVSREVIPHEGAVRSWLARARVSPEDIDELIQDSYCRLAMLDSVEHIARADAYFFSIARNLLVRRLRRAKVVAIEAIAEIDAYRDDTRPSPEQEAAARLDHARLLGLMAKLPERCRRIVELRKFEGCSQKETAERLGVSESVVENDTYQGVKAILRAWREADRALAVRFDGFGAEERT
jgi:RNA polymerase sigma-70 factor (ECF subfamily)